MENINQEEKKMEKGRELEILARENFAVWNQALLSLDSRKVAELYADDASFLPTLNPELKKGEEGVEQYFKHFLEKHPEGKIVEGVVQEISADENGDVSAFLHSGLYNFAVGEPNNRQIVEARFTFLWQKDKNGAWKIKHHHSSLKPSV
jgi:uncharacterized protein (TIGR02246 family)